MKINKKSSEYSKSAVEMLVLLGGVAAGYFVSGAAYEALKNAGDSKSTNLVKRGGIATAGVASIAIGGNDEMANALKGAGVGIVVRQLFDGGKEALASSSTAAKLTAGNKMQKAIAGGFGLACPCENSQYQIELQPLKRPARKGMGSPTLSALGNPSEANSLTAAVNQGRMLRAA